MKIAICDDVACERATIKEFLHAYFLECDVTEFENGSALVEAHGVQQFDLVFLDLLMPGINGIEAAEKIRVFDEHTPIIFVTTTAEFAVQSYRVLAFDYLLKPISTDAMTRCLNRFTKLVPDQRSIKVDYMGVHTSILLHNIIYLESSLRKVVIHLSGGEQITLTAKMDDFSDLSLETDFCRCHKSFLVNLAYVDSITGEDFYLSNDKVLRISRSYSSSAKKTYFDYVFRKGVMRNE